MFAARNSFFTPGGDIALGAVSDNFLLWLDAADFNGTTWTAKKGISPTKNGTVTASTYSGYPSVLFGANGYFTVPSFVAPSHLAAFVVMYQPSGKPLIVEHSATANSNPGFYFYSNNTFPYRVTRTENIGFNTTDDSDWFADGSFALGAINFDGTNLNLQYNGTDIPTSVAVGTVSSLPISTNVTDTLNIGSRNGSSIFFTSGHLCELILSPKLSSGEYSTVTTFLKTKYSL